MAQYDSIEINNPTSEDFTWNYNGEPYTIKAGETKGFVTHVAFHLAKHLSTKMIQEDEKSKMTKKDRDNPNAGIHRKISQLAIYDTHERRTALYKILSNENLVIECLKRYPFKDFIGDMEIYKKFVKSKTESKSAKVKAEAVS